MLEIVIKYFNTTYGELLLGSYNDEICLCDWAYRSMRSRIDKRIQSGLMASFREGRAPILDNLESQLNQYFLGERKNFDLPLRTIGSDFQKEVWKALLDLRYGDTETYAGLAERVGRPAAIRAVGSANGANAIAILIPCHRIVGSNGSLGGYAGGLNAKRRLLDLEKQPLLNW